MTSSRTLMRPIRPVHHRCHAVPKPAMQFLTLCPSVGVEPAQAAKRALALVKAPGDPQPMRALEQQPATQFRNSLVSVALPQNLGSPDDPEFEAVFLFLFSILGLSEIKRSTLEVQPMGPGKFVKRSKSGNSRYGAPNGKNVFQSGASNCIWLQVRVSLFSHRDQIGCALGEVV